jgi:hypothetical protein
MSALLPAAVAAATPATAPDAPADTSADAARLDAVGLVLVGASTVVTMDRIGRERVFEDSEIPQARRACVSHAFVTLLTLRSALQADLLAAITAVDGILAALPTEMLQARG